MEKAAPAEDAAPAPAPKPSRRRRTPGAAALVVAGVCGVVLLRLLAFEPFSIPSGSMLPTLLVGDDLLVSRYPYGYSRFSLPFSPNLFEGRILGRLPARGDVVVFKYPRDTAVDYIKRVVGLPGDRVQMRAGQLYINGVACPRQPAGDYVAEDNGVRLLSHLYHETLPNGATYDILKQQDTGALNDTPEFAVPGGHLFVLGDNRDNSADSRFAGSNGVGFVPVENLVGRADLVLLSMNGAAGGGDGGPGIRWTRMLQGVH